MSTPDVFPQVIATGGLEACAGVFMNLAHPMLLLPPDALFSLAAGCLDAPQSFPCGSLVAPAIGTWARREEIKP